MRDDQIELPSQEDRPLVTFALFAYNQEKYVREAIEGAFAQTYEPLEIILSDDCSTDKTFDIMEKMAAEYTGSHKILLNKNSINLGVADHINNVMSLAEGELIVAAAGDDVSFPERTSIVVAEWLAANKSNGSLYSHFNVINKNGDTSAFKARPKAIVSISDQNISLLNNFSGISGCTHAWTKSIFEIFGPLDKRIEHEDVSIPLRSLLIGTLTYIPKELVDYRLTEGSITRKAFINSSERFKKMEKYWSGRVAIFDQLERDVIVATNKQLVDKDHLDWLFNQAKQAKIYALDQQSLCMSGRFKRLLFVINPISSLNIRDRLKWFFIVVFPSIYGSRFVRFLR